MSTERETLMKALEFHGHRCWASVAGVRAGLAALRVLNVKRAGGRQLQAIVEIGEEHGGTCWGDGVQYATGCTLGKANMEKMNYGKLAVTVVERASNRAVRVSYKPTLQKRIGESAFMVKRGQGVEPDKIPEAEQMELVDLIWNAPRVRCPQHWRHLPVRARLASGYHGLRALRGLPRTHRVGLPAGGGGEACLHPVFGMRAMTERQP